MIKLNAQIRVQRLAGKVLLVPSDAAGGPLQTKTVYPSHSEQVVLPDDDFYGLAAVTLVAVPKLKTADAALVEGCGWFKTGLDVSNISELFEETEG